MTGGRWMRASDRWLGMLLHLYPADFRDEMGESIREAYLDRCRAAERRGGAPAVVGVWLQALGDSLRNGVAERVRPAVTWRRSGNWGRDGEHALRRLVRAPVFTLSVLGTLVVGLGAFAMVFAVVAKVLLAPLPYERADDLYYVWRDYTWLDLDRGWLAGTDVVALDSAGGPIDDVVGLRLARRTLATTASDAGLGPEEVPVMLTTPNIFGVLGVQPMLGRGFTAEEAGPGRPAVAVLTHDLWRRRFGGDSTLLGREIRLDGAPFTVIGIMGPDFHFVRHASLGRTDRADVYTTFEIDLATTNPNAGGYAGLVRARPGTTPERLAATITAVGLTVDERHFEKRGVRLYPVGLEEDLVAGVRPSLVVLGLAGVFLVLVLAVNLASLLLMRASQREREFAISRALGANPLALARATLFEGALLGAAGGAGGALLAVWGTRALVALAPLELPRRETVAVDWSVAAVVVAVGLVLGLLAGAVPAAWATRTGLTNLLSNAAVRGGGGGQGTMRRAMVVVQVALSVVLLSAGGLVGRSFERLLRADPGFEPAQVTTFRLPLIESRYPDDERVSALHARVAGALAAIPGVTSVGAASALPLTAGPDQMGLELPGAPGNTGDEEHDGPLVDVIAARAGYLEALGIRVLDGRAFDQAYVPGRREALLDRTLAAAFYPGGGAVGRTVVLNGDSMVVAGVVEHARQYEPHEDGRPQVYVRNEAYTYATLSWAVRSERPTESLTPEIRAAVRTIDPELALADVRSMDEVLGESLRQQRLSAVLITGFSLGALLLAAMGLFGVVSGSVTRRRHELAVRLALGADHRRVLRLVLGEGARLVALGLLVGVPGVYYAGRALAGVLVGVSPFDPPTLAAVVGGLALVAFVACWLPARRVAGIDPARALRQD